MGQKVSLLTSVTWPTVCSTVSKLDLTLNLEPSLTWCFIDEEATANEELLELFEEAEEEWKEDWAEMAVVWHFDGRESGDRTAEEEEENWRWRRDIVFRGVLETPVKTRERLAK